MRNPETAAMIARRHLAKGDWPSLSQARRERLAACMVGMTPDEMRAWRSGTVAHIVDDDGKTMLRFDPPVSWEEAWEALAAVDVETARLFDEIERS